MGATKSRLAKLQDVDEQFQFSQDDTELVPQLTSPRLPEKTLNVSISYWVLYLSWISSKTLFIYASISEC